MSAKIEQQPYQSYIPKGINLVETEIKNTHNVRPDTTNHKKSSQKTLNQSVLQDSRIETLSTNYMSTFSIRPIEIEPSGEVVNEHFTLSPLLASNGAMTSPNSHEKVIQFNQNNTSSKRSSTPKTMSDTLLRK